MINKKVLSSIIEKYHLKGLCNSVLWKTENNKLTVDFITQNKDMIGNLEYSGFPLKNSSLAIYDTDLLNKQLNITSGDIQLDVIEKKGISNKLIMADSKYNIEFALANPILIPPAGRVNEPDIYNIEMDLNNESIVAMIKAKNALPKINTMKIYVENNFYGGHDLSIIFGDVNDYSNKIKYNIESITLNKSFDLELIFNSDLFKEILDANKNASTGKMYIFSEGLMKLYFEENNIKSEYFLICI